MTFSAGSGSTRRSTNRRPPTPTAQSSLSRSNRDRPAARPTAPARRTDRTATRNARSSSNPRTTNNPRNSNQSARMTRSARPSFNSFSKLRPLILPTDVPPWLRQLLQVQQGVWISTIALSTIALGAYGWSVYSQQQWGKAYSQLERLQRNERQLTANKEMMKNQIAQQVDPEALGLAPQKSNEVIFIKPDPNPSAPPAAKAEPPPTLPANQPLGY